MLVYKNQNYSLILNLNINNIQVDRYVLILNSNEIYLLKTYIAS